MSGCLPTDANGAIAKSLLRKPWVGEEVAVTLRRFSASAEDFGCLGRILPLSGRGAHGRMMARPEGGGARVCEFGMEGRES